MLEKRDNAYRSKSEGAVGERVVKSVTPGQMVVKLVHDELIKTLSRIMNRARQDSITTEIMEIVGGAEGLAASGDDDGDTYEERPRKVNPNRNNVGILINADND